MTSALDLLTASIRPLVERYFHALDTRDFELLEMCFLPESEMSYFGGEVVDKTRDAFIERLKALMTFKASTHTYSNMIVHQTDTAVHGEVIATAHLLTADKRLRVRGLHYSDQYIDSEFGWRILRRVHRATWEFEVPANSLSSPNKFSKEV